MKKFEDEIFQEIRGCCICDESARSAANKVVRLVKNMLNNIYEITLQVINEWKNTKPSIKGVHPLSVYCRRHIDYNGDIKW